MTTCTCIYLVYNHYHNSILCMYLLPCFSQGTVPSHTEVQAHASERHRTTVSQFIVVSLACLVMIEMSSLLVRERKGGGERIEGGGG